MKFYASRLFILILLLSGCSSASIQGEVFVKVNRDGSGEYRFTLLTHPIGIKYFQEYKAALKHHQFQIKEISKGEQVGWIATKEVSNLLREPFPLSISSSTTDSPVNKVIHTHSGFYFKEIYIDYPLDLTFITREAPLTRLLSDRIHLHLMVSLPIPLKEHNADAISPDKKTATWKLKVGEINPIRAKVTVLNPIGWISTIVCLLLVLVPVFILVKHKNKKTSLH